MRALYLSETGDAGKDLPEAYAAALRRVVELSVEIVPEPLEEKAKLDLFRSHDIYLVGRASSPLPGGLAVDPGRLRLVAAAVGSLRHILAPDHFRAGIRVANWGDAPAFIIAEGTLVLLLAALKDLRTQVDLIAGGGWQLDQASHGGTIEGARVGLYGFGFIGAEFVRLLRPFRPRAVRIYDPYAETLPRWCRRASSLEELFADSDIVSIHAGLSDETRGSVGARLLAMLPSGAVVVNTARGAIIDQDALFQELSRGRLRAGLDVLEPDSLPPGHPARLWPNLLLTAHQIGWGWPSSYGGSHYAGILSKAQRYVVDNLRRFARNEPLRWEVDAVRFLRMT